MTRLRSVEEPLIEQPASRLTALIVDTALAVTLLFRGLPLAF